MTELAKTIYSSLIGSKNPTHLWLPNDAEYIKLAKYLEEQIQPLIGNEVIREKGIFADKDIICHSCNAHWNMSDNDTVFFNYCPLCGEKICKKTE